MSKPNVLVLAGAAPQFPQYSRDGALMTASLTEAGFKVTQTADANVLKSLNTGANQVVVLYTFGDYLDDAQIAALVKFVQGGGGVVGIHTAIATTPASDALGKLFGARIVSGYIGEHAIHVSDPNHPIAHRVQDFRMDDELYVTEKKSDFHPFLSTKFQGNTCPMGWTRNEGAGKVVYLGNGHTPGGLTHPTFKQLLARSVRFSAGEDWSGKSMKIAAVGYGQEFKMAKIHLQSAEKSRLKAVGVADIDPKVLEVAESDFPNGIATFNSLDEMLKLSDAEMITLVTPHNLHAPMALQCLAAGKHVVTEKPFTVSVAEATAVIDAARKAGKLATVFHNRRWDGDFVAIRNLVQSGVIGDVFHIECCFGGYHEPREWWRSYKEPSGGAFFDWGAHFVDWALQLMPHKIESISGDFKKLRHHHITNEDFSSAYVRFEGGRSATFETSNTTAIMKPAWRILGTKGGIEKPRDNPDYKEALRLVTYKDGQRIDGKVHYGKSDWDGFYRNVADHLLLGEPLIVTPESARKVIAVLNLAEESSKQGGVPVKLPFEQ
jgi:scyllo-inositol 2-dehydrogenase (NADP+)